MKKGLGTVILVFAFLVTCSEGLRGEEFEVSTAGELQAALSTAQANGQGDIIKVAQGTYYGTFTYESSENFSIALEGGYTSDFKDRVVNPSNTVLDASNLGRVLTIYSEGAEGDITIEGFTIRNGNAEADSGGGIYAYSYVEGSSSGNIIIAHNIITGNAAKYGGGGVFAESFALDSSSDVSINSGDISLEYNTIRGNASGGVGAGAVVYTTAIGDSDEQAGDIYFAFNTVTGNSTDLYWAVFIWITGFGDARGGHIEFINNLIAENNRGGVNFNIDGVDSYATCTNNTIADNTFQGLNILSEHGGTIDVYNNIMWNNWDTNENEFRDIGILPLDGGELKGFNNDYFVMVIGDGYSDWTNEAGNINLPPLFRDTGDYHLLLTSPCIDSGDNLAPSLPAEDIEGYPRILDGDDFGAEVVDMGAFEYFGLPVSIDIKPGSCPNPLNLVSEGVLPIAVLGTEDFDVTIIDPASIKLEGISPLRWDYEDVATPFEGELCDCHELEGDGYIDLALKFDTQELVASLGEISHADVITVTITGRLKDEFGGEKIRGRDCIVIKKK